MNTKFDEGVETISLITTEGYGECWEKWINIEILNHWFKCL